MIDFYSWITPNGFKVAIALEELGLPYRAHAIDIEKGAQFSQDYVTINPAGKIPAIVDHETGTVLTESSAILLYLAEKAGDLMPALPAERLEAMEWLLWQSSSFGPTLGYAHYFLSYHRGQAPFAEERFRADVVRLYETLERRLGGRAYVVGDYSVVDIAIWPWVSRFERHHVDLSRYPAVHRWYERVSQRDAVQRGYGVPFASGAIPHVVAPLS